MKVLSIISISLSLLFVSCDRNKKVQDLTEKLNQRDHEILLLQQQLKSKGDSLNTLKNLIDSTTVETDSVGLFDPALAGNWQVKMVCTETSCEGSAIGDTKTEQWNISYENNQVVAKASTKNQLSRIYTGVYKNKSLHLSAIQSALNTTIKVTLQQTKDNTLEGVREIFMGQGCKIIYSLHLVKQL